eukprot:360874-Chlamydomonas_euryale.AAC.2
MSGEVGKQPDDGGWHALPSEPEQPVERGSARSNSASSVSWRKPAVGQIEGYSSPFWRSAHKLYACCFTFLLLLQLFSAGAVLEDLAPIIDRRIPRMITCRHGQSSSTGSTSATPSRACCKSQIGLQACMHSMLPPSQPASTPVVPGLRHTGAPLSHCRGPYLGRCASLRRRRDPLRLADSGRFGS